MYPSLVTFWVELYVPSLMAFWVVLYVPLPVTFCVELYVPLPCDVLGGGVCAVRWPTLGPKLALTRPNSPLEIMFKFPYLAEKRIISHKLAHSRHCNFNSRNPFYKLQTGPTGKSGPPERWTIFSKSSPVGLSIVLKFPEILVEWITPNTSSTLRVIHN